MAIANDTVKKQRSRTMEKNFFWITNQVEIQNFNITWHPGQENLARYFTKIFEARHHQLVRPYYLHMHNSPTSLPQALAPCTLKGCVGTLPNGYTRTVPLPLPQTEIGSLHRGHTSLTQNQTICHSLVTSEHTIHKLSSNTRQAIQVNYSRIN